jgi:hypothetical protein
MVNNIKTIKSSPVLMQIPQAVTFRRNVESLGQLSRIVAAMGSRGIECHAATIGASHILDGSGAQYYFDCLLSDYNAVIGIMREAK